MARAPKDTLNYVVRSGPLFQVFWNGEFHSNHPNPKEAGLALWRLGKIHKATGAEPRPVTRGDRIASQSYDVLEKLQRSPNPNRVLSGLPCPDCGSHLTLRNGKFGLFYGCEMYSETGCRGSVSADRNGIPLGDPVPAATRRLRHIIRQVMNFLWEEVKVIATLNSGEIGKLNSFTHEECRAALADLMEQWPETLEFVHKLPDHIQRTKLERMLADTDDEDFGVDLEKI